MKFGLIPVNVGVGHVDKMIEVSVAAENAGFDSVWTFEHAVVPVDYQSKYPYSPDGKMGVPPEANFVDPLIALTAVATHTKTLRLATGVNILPQTNPLYLAKQAASLDWVSGGRFMLGVGIGWLKEEFDALGVPFEHRGARFDDYVQAMRKVWSGDVVEHHSQFLDWSGFKSHPVPIQQPLPVVIGGSKGKAFQRIARYGQGWYAPTGSVDQLVGLLKQLEEACAAEDRDPSTVEVTAMWFPGAEGVDSVPRYEDAGVARLVVPIFALGGGDPKDAVARFGDEVIAKQG
jgi:probable F420-dependent oxidoreductase